MALSDADIERYARQIVIPGIGARGQEALLSAIVAVVGDETGAAHAELYLRAAGVGVMRDAVAGVGVAVACEPALLSSSIRDRLEASTAPVCWYELTERGFRAGIHPHAPLPSRREPASTPSSALTPILHSIAAVDAAASACACILALPHRNGPYEVEVWK